MGDASFSMPSCVCACAHARARVRAFTLACGCGIVCLCLWLVSECTSVCNPVLVHALSCLCLDLHVVQGAIAVTVEQLEKFRDLVGQVLSVKMGQALRSAARSLINCSCLGANRVKGAD